MSTATALKTIPVAKPSFGVEEETALIDALRSGWVSQGPRVAEFERDFSHYVSAPFAVAVSSCTTALHLVLTALGVGPGDEVICPSLSFIATANAIVHTGAKPVFADIDPITYNLDPRKVEEAITPRTRAILVVHQIGLPAALEELSQIAQRHGLFLLEDAACAIGAEYSGARIGQPYGSAACFSFHPRKILTTGEGGMITTKDEALSERLRGLRQHAMSVSDLARHGSKKVTIETYDEVGYNYRMTDLQAAVGIVQLTRLNDMIRRRRNLASRYIDDLQSLTWLILPQEAKNCKHNYQSFMVRLTNDAPVSRDELIQMLLDRGISTRRAIMAIHREKPYRGDHWEASLPVTNSVTETGLILPLFHEMTEGDQEHVVASLRTVS